MADLKWLDGYSGQTVEQMLSLEATHRIDSLVLAIEEMLGQKAAREGEQSLTDEERTVLAIEALEREVNNGGYEQFFINSSRECAPVIVEALLQIGCIRTAEITQAAIAALRVPALTVEAIEQAIDAEDTGTDEILEECDRQYYEGSDDIEGQLFAFIKARKTNITP